MEKFDYKGDKGPFKVNNQCDLKVQGLTVSEISHEPCWVALVRGDDIQQRINTAHLFAAAPLLLSALIKAVEAVGVAMEEADRFNFPSNPPDWYAEAEVAIHAALNINPENVEK